MDIPDLELVEAPDSILGEAARDGPKISTSTNRRQRVRQPDGDIYLQWSGVEFLVSNDGHRVLGRSLDGVSDIAFQTYLLGQVLSCALVKQGIEPLHSTTVVVNGQAISFVGDCGYGKSSLGATFLQAGYPLLTDDLLVLKEDRDGFIAYPGVPRIKLFPVIATRCFGESVKGTPMNPLTPKLIIQLNEKQACRVPVPLKRIYVLTTPRRAARRKSITIRQLSKRNAMVELVTNTFNTVIDEPARLARQFDFTTRVASLVPVKRLSYPRSVDLLPAIRRAILDDLRP